MNAYAVFYQENYASLADRLKTKTKKVRALEVAKAWRALSKEEKDVYVEKAREISRERREKRDALASEKKSAK
jgi:DNA-dependent RNA polymerase auxiliary subunit epsilon